MINYDRTSGKLVVRRVAGRPDNIGKPKYYTGDPTISSYWTDDICMAMNFLNRNPLPILNSHLEFWTVPDPIDEIMREIMYE